MSITNFHGHTLVSMDRWTHLVWIMQVRSSSSSSSRYARSRSRSRSRSGSRCPPHSFSVERFIRLWPNGSAIFSSKICPFSMLSSSQTNSVPIGQDRSRKDWLKEDDFQAILKAPGPQKRQAEDLKGGPPFWKDRNFSLLKFNSQIPPTIAIFEAGDTCSIQTIIF